MHENSYYTLSKEAIDFYDFAFNQGAQFSGKVSVVVKTKEGMKVVSSVSADKLRNALENIKLYTNTDYYITKSTSKKLSSWKKADLFSLNVILVDIDYHLSNLDESELSKIINQIKFAATVGEFPYPNAYIRTGRGVHVVFVIEQTSAKLSGLYRFVASQYATKIQRIIDAMGVNKAWNVDSKVSKSASGLMRLAGSVNSIVNKKVELSFVHDTRVDLAKEYENQLCDAERRGFNSSAKTKKAKKKKQFKLSGPFERKRALDKLLSLRGDIGIGERDIFLFIYKATLDWCGYSPDDVKRTILEINSCFSNPLRENELEKCICRPQKHYRLKNSTIIDWLEITSKEQKLIGLSPAKSGASKNAARDQRVADRREKRNKNVIRLFEKTNLLWKRQKKWAFHITL